MNVLCVCLQVWINHLFVCTNASSEQNIPQINIKHNDLWANKTNQTYDDDKPNTIGDGWNGFWKKRTNNAIAKKREKKKFIIKKKQIQWNTMYVAFVLIAHHVLYSDVHTLDAYIWFVSSMTRKLNYAHTYNLCSIVHTVCVVDSLCVY